MLEGKRIAVLIEDSFIDLVFAEPLRAMKAANARVVIVGTDLRQIYRSKSKKRTFSSDIKADMAEAQDFDAIIIAGSYASYRVELYQSAVELVKRAYSLGRIVAAICYGPQLLVSADIVRGHRMTSWPSIAADLRNAGADWVDESVVRDRNIITSRKPADLPMFNKTIIDAVAENSRSLGDTISFR